MLEIPTALVFCMCTLRTRTRKSATQVTQLRCGQCWCIQQQVGVVHGYECDRLSSLSVYVL